MDGAEAGVFEDIVVGAMVLGWQREEIGLEDGEIGLTGGLSLELRNGGVCKIECGHLEAMLREQQGVVTETGAGIEDPARRQPGRWVVQQ